MSQETTTPPTIYRRGIWYLSDVVYERLTLFNYWEMLGFLCAVALSLVLVYPHKDLQARLAASEKLSPNDPLTLEYLRVFLRADPENHDLRLPFASRLIRLGLYHEAREVLTPLHSLNNADLHYQALWLELLIVEQEHYAIPKNSPLYAAAVARHFAHLRLILNQKLNAEQYIMLGQKAWTAGANDIAIESFRRLTLIPHLPGATYAAAALAMIGLGDYRGSAEMYFLAMKNSASLGEKRRYFMAGISTLQAASMFDVALATADRFLTIFIHDTETLVFLARFARAANRPELARRYAKLYMRMSQLDMPQYGWQAMPQPVGFNPNFLIHATWRGGAQADFLRVANSKPPVVSGDVPSLPFDDQAYLLAHDIFLGADKQDEAIRVAKAAVDQRPNSAPWRKRLANLYDWSGNYNESATQWLAYAKLTNDETAWDRVLGLARSMNDLDALRLVLEHKVRYEPKREGWLNELLNLYDVRGEPELQIKFLEGLFDETKDVELKEKYLLRQVEILEWRQDIEHALEKTLLLKKYFGRKVSYAKKLATFLARKRQFKEAFLELYIVRDQVPTDDEEFWHNYSEMGNFFQDDDASEEGYRALLDSGYDTETDLTNLLYLWSLPNPRAAAQLAVFAYFNAVKVSPLILEVRITSEANLINDTELRLINRLKSYPNVFAIAALDLFVKLLDWDSAHQFLNSLTPAQLRVLEEDVRFLSPRATMRQFTHDLVGAKKDLRAALDKTPDNMDLRAGLMWVLIASRDVEPLKQALVLWAGDAEDSEVLWAPFAAALMSLNRPNEALHWLRRAGIQRQDYLWQMSYADCLDANSQPDLAWRIRRRAWTDLRKPEVLQSISPKLFINMRDRLAALSSMFDTGDGAKRILQQLLRADVSAVQEASKKRDFPSTGRELVRRVVTPNELVGPKEKTEEDMTVANLFQVGTGKRPSDDARLSSSAKELALAYAQNNDGHDLARVWLATRFANQLAKPLSEELALLLEEDDRVGVARMLDNLPDLLPMYDRIEAAHRVGSPALAQTWAFDQFNRLPQDEQLHSQLTDLTMLDSSSLQWHTLSQQQDSLNTLENSLDMGFAVTPKWSITPRVMWRNQSSSDPINLPNVPAQDRTLSFTLRKLTDSGFVATTLQERQAMVNHQGLSLDYSSAWARELDVGIKVGINQPAQETSLLHLGGMRTGIETDFTYQVTRREYVRLDLGVQRYASQAGTFLGAGNYWNVDVGSHIRLEYPDIIARCYMSQAQFNSSGLFDAQIARLAPVGTNLATFVFTPESSATTGCSLGLGISAEKQYVRGWRPFTELGFSSNSITGFGYDFRAGASGSVLGNDVLRLHVQALTNKPMSQQSSRELGIQYQWFY